MPVGTYALSFDLGASYRSSVGVGFPNNPYTTQDAYTLVNGAIGFGADDGSWRLSVFGKNLTDEEYVAVMIATPLGGAPMNISQFIPYEARRIVGLSLDVNF
jgi:iron complex outermembrane receptor protein